MPLTIGDRLAHYEVTALIGEGGMGRVYQATDTKLNRQVALKILPEAFASDSDRLARFQREAQVLASLNHPNIAAIYGLEEAEDTRALVLELVEGPTLEDRIAQGPIPVDEALPIAKQIAEALEAAHEAGVIHRDLKPANIKVREDGTVKVLDFGLAKALDTTLEGDPSQSPTLTAAATQMGVIMGTAAYMSPEQARGKPVDRRADIWAFGVVVYEMLTGARPFQGEDVSLTLASVMKSDVDVKTLPSDLPETLRTVLRRCLEKEPLQRLRDMGDVRLAMAGAFDSTPVGSEERAVTPRPALWQRPAVLVLAGVFLVVLGGVISGLLVRGSNRDPRPITRFRITLPEGGEFSGILSTLALSPDGTQLVYAANDQLYLRPLAQSEARAVRGTDVGTAPFFSADGQWIGFWQRSVLKKVSVSGGAPVTLVETLVDLWGARWEADDSILLGQGPAGIWRVSAAGGVPEVLVAVEDGEEAADPQMLPGGEWVLFTLRPRGTSSWDDAQVVAQSLDTGERRVLIPGGRDGRYVATGHLVYVLEGQLFAAPFDIEGLASGQNPVAMVEGVAVSVNDRSPAWDLSDDGTLVYVAGAGEVESGLVWVDRAGQMTPLVQGRGQYRWPSLSQDNQLIALTVSASRQDLWLYDIARGALTRFTDEAAGTAPVWTPDGSNVTFGWDISGTFDLYQKPADGSGEAELLFETTAAKVPSSWTPDGSALVFHEFTATDTQRDIWMVGHEGAASAFLATEFNELAPAVSPDGRWLAYASDQSGEYQIYVQPFPEGGAVVPISTGAGTEPVWSRDGTELFFRTGNQMMVVDVQLGALFSAGRPQVLFDGAYERDPLGVGLRNYDVASDGRFLMISGGAGVPAQIEVVLNWTQELLERVPIP